MAICASEKEQANEIATTRFSCCLTLGCACFIQSDLAEETAVQDYFEILEKSKHLRAAFLYNGDWMQGDRHTPHDHKPCSCCAAISILTQLQCIPEYSGFGTAHALYNIPYIVSEQYRPTTLQ